MKSELSFFNSIKSYGNILHSNCDDSDSILKVQKFVICSFFIAQRAVKSWIIAKPLECSYPLKLKIYLSFSLRKCKPKLQNLKRQVFMQHPLYMVSLNSFSYFAGIGNKS